MENSKLLIDLTRLTDGERIEMKKLGILSDENAIIESVYPAIHNERPPIPKHVTHAPHVINEAYDYQKPSSFSRALRLDLGDYKVLLISGQPALTSKVRPNILVILKPSSGELM
jgi:hypothetical protein